MSLEDAIGSGPDFTADSVLDRVSRSVLPDLPENVSADAVLNRLNRKLSLTKPKEEESEKPEKKAKPDFTSEGTPAGDIPDLSQYGTPAVTPPPLPPLGVTGNLIAAAKGVPAGAAEATGGILQGAARLHNQAQPYLQSLQYDPEGNVIGQAPVQPQAPIEQHPLYKAGQTVKDLAPEMSPAEKESIGGRLGTGVGSIAPYAAATILGGPEIGIAAGFTGMSADTYGKVYEEAKKHGADDDTASSAASKSALAAGVLGSLPLGAGKYAQSLIAKMATSSAAFATAGEAQEAILEQIAKDYDPKAGYTLDQKRLIAELILGAAMGGLHHAAEGRAADAAADQPTAEAPQPDAQARAPAEGLPPPGEEQPASAQSTGTPPHGPDTGASGAGAQGGPQPGPDTGGPGAAEEPRAQQAPPPGPEPEAEPARGAKGADYTMDPATRAKMEKVFRQFEPGVDPSKMSDADLFNKLNDHLRDTSSTGYTAKPETAEEKAAREETAKKRDEDDILRKAGWSEAHINAMRPDQRADYLARARGPREKAAGASEDPVSKKQGEKSISPEAENVPSGTREAPIRPATADDVVRAQASEPTPAQAIADNYKQAHVELPHLGLSGKNGITIETGVGGTRKSKEIGPNGKPTWETTMQHGAYGKIRGTKGADGDHLDIFVGPHPASPHVFVLDQLKPNGSFDEHKVLAGYRTPLDAMHGYVNSYNDLAKGRVGGMTAFTPDQFKVWLRNGDHTKPLMSGQKLEVGTAVTSAAAPKETPAEQGAQPAESVPKTPVPVNSSSEHGAFDAIRSTIAPEDGEPAASAVAEKRRPGEGKEAVANGERVPDSGAESGQDQDEIAVHRDAIEKALGPDADRVSQVDIASAAEMMADHPDMDVAAAFGRAVIQNAVRQKFLTALEAAKAYGQEVNEVLGTEREGASGGGTHAEPSRTEPRQERASGTGETRELPGSSEVGSHSASAEVQNEPADDTAGKDTNAERNASREAAPAEAEREAAQGTAAKPKKSEPSVTDSDVDKSGRSRGRTPERVDDGVTHRSARASPEKPKPSVERPIDVKSQQSNISKVDNGYKAAARQILEAIERDHPDEREYGLRVIPGEFDGAINAGDILPPSLRWENGDATSESLAGTSATEIKENTEQGVIRALELLGAHGKAGPNGYYFGTRVVLVKGKILSKGDDVGEVLIKSPTVLGVWNKPDDGNSEVQPNESSLRASGRAQEPKPTVEKGAEEKELAKQGTEKLLPPAQRGPVEAAVRELMKRLLGEHVKVHFQNGLIGLGEHAKARWGELGESAKAKGMYYPYRHIIRLALTDGIDETAFHEAYHASEYQLQTPQERALMERETPAIRKWIAKKRGYSDAEVNGMAPEEVRAVGAEEYMKERLDNSENPGSGLHVGVRRWWQRLWDALRALANKLRGMGFKTYNDIYGDLYEGKHADRAGDTPRREADRRKEEVHEEDLGRSDEALASIFDRFRGAQDAKVKTRIKNLMESTAWNRFVERYQNLSEPVKRLNEAVEARMNGTLPDSKAFYLKKRLFPGKVGNEVKNFEKDFLDPLIETLKSSKVDLKEVGDLLYARHAPERNAEINKINPSLKGDGSGMSDAEARQLRVDFESKYGKDLPRDIAKQVAAIREYILSAMEFHGLESPEVIQAWRNKYKHYVPLGGFEEVREDATESLGEPAKFNIRGKEVKQALGRSSKANNPLVNLLDQAYRTIERGKKNEYLQSLDSALQSLGKDDLKGFAARDQSKPTRVISKKTGLVHSIDTGTYANDSKAVAFKIAGKTHYWVFEDRDLADAIKRMHADGLGMFQGVLDLQNKLKSLWTHYSPDFLIRHFIFRYPIEGTLNSFEQRDSGPHSVARYVRDAVPLMGRASKAIFASNSGKRHSDPEVQQLQRYWNEMRNAGGAMVFRQMRDTNLTREHLNQKLSSLAKSPLQSLKDRQKAMIEAMDVVTNTLDNSLRLAAYSSARNQDKSVEQSALIAREATVDFQLTGKWKNAIGLIFPFGNIAIQTGSRLTSAVTRSRRMGAVFAGTMLAGFLSTMFNYLVGDKDTDGRYFMDKIPLWERKLNFTILNPFHHDEKNRPVPIHIAMPYNWAFPMTIGSAFATMALGQDPHRFRAMLGMITKAGVEVATPFGQEDNKAAMLSPELVRPFIHAYTNENYNGVPVHKEPLYQKGPNAESGRKTTGDGWKYVSSAINSATGGNKHHQGALDFYPEDLRLMFDYVLGSQRRFAENVFNTGKNAVEGNPPDWSHIPLARVLMGTDYDAANRAHHYEVLDQHEHPWKR